MTNRKILFGGFVCVHQTRKYLCMYFPLLLTSDLSQGFAAGLQSHSPDGKQWEHALVTSCSVGESTLMVSLPTPSRLLYSLLIVCVT